MGRSQVTYDGEQLVVTGIDRVHLVNQYQRPNLGHYTWDVVEEMPLG